MVGPNHIGSPRWTGQAHIWVGQSEIVTILMNYSVNLSSPKWSNLRWLTQYGLAQVDKSTSLYSPNCWSTQFCHIFCKESANFVIFVLSILSPFSIGLWQELILELSSHSLTLFHYDSWFESQLRIDSYVDAT